MTKFSKDLGGAMVPLALLVAPMASPDL